MTTNTTGGSSDCSLAVLSTRLGQQNEQSARDRHHIDKLSQQLSDITTQLAHISKILDCPLASHIPMTALVEVTAVPSSSPVSGTAPSGQAPPLPQQTLPWMGPISPSTASTSRGRELHSATWGSHNPVVIYRTKHFPSRARPTTAPGTTLPGPSFPQIP